MQSACMFGETQLAYSAGQSTTMRHIRVAMLIPHHNGVCYFWHTCCCTTLPGHYLAHARGPGNYYVQCVCVSIPEDVAALQMTFKHKGFIFINTIMKVLPFDTKYSSCLDHLQAAGSTESLRHSAMRLQDMTTRYGQRTSLNVTMRCGDDIMMLLQKYPCQKIDCSRCLMVWQQTCKLHVLWPPKCVTRSLRPREKRQFCHRFIWMPWLFREGWWVQPSLFVGIDIL